MTLDRKKMKKKRAAGGETISLLSVDINSLEAESLSKSRASSMLDISETASGEENVLVSSVFIKSHVFCLHLCCNNLQMAFCKVR